MKWYKSKDGKYIYFGKLITWGGVHCNFVGHMFVDLPHSFKPESGYKIGSHGFHRVMVNDETEGVVQHFFCISGFIEVADINEIPQWCKNEL